MKTAENFAAGFFGVPEYLSEVNIEILVETRHGMSTTLALQMRFARTRKLLAREVLEVFWLSSSLLMLVSDFEASQLCRMDAELP